MNGSGCTEKTARSLSNLPLSLNLEVPLYAWYCQSDCATPNSNSPARTVFIL